MTLFFAIFLAVPFAYNSCQNSLLTGTGFASASSCKAALSGGRITELKFDPNAPPRPFASRKVRLDNTSERRNLPEISLAKGTQLAVLMDNRCLQENPNGGDSSSISQSAQRTTPMFNELERQVYLWPADRDTTNIEIETRVAAESCVLGVARNQRYKTQSVTFNDPLFPQQAHFPFIRALEAYNAIYSGNGGSGFLPVTGKPVILATVDTGVDYDHPDLKEALWSDGRGNGIDIPSMNNGNVLFDPMDISSIGHGTHVSGLIAAMPNDGIGTVGVMPYRALIMGVKVFEIDNNGNESTTSQYVAQGVQWASQNGASVINLSLGAITQGPASDPIIEAAIDAAVQNGSVVTVVIGNNDNGQGQLIDGVNVSSLPGQFSTMPGVIGVGAIDASTGNISVFSNYSTTYAEIGAPGALQGYTGLYSTIAQSVSPGSPYGQLAGTSQAAPIVAAAAGLTFAMIRESYGITPTPAEVEDLIEGSADKSPALTPYFKNGNQLDLVNLVQAVQTTYPLTASPQSVTLSPDCP